MKRIITALMLLASTGHLFAQSSATYLKVRVIDSIRLGDNNVRAFSTDATLADSADNVLPTQSAVKGAISKLKADFQDSISSIPASKITSGVISPARLGTGFPNFLNMLRGDGVWVSEITPSSVNAGGVIKGQTLEVDAGRVYEASNIVGLEHKISRNGIRFGNTLGDYWLGTGTATVPAEVSFGGEEELLTVNTTTGKVGRASNVGTVTSVGIGMPSIFTVLNPIVTSSGTLQVSLTNQAQGTVFAAPSNGTSTPSFRTLQATDIPNLDAAKITMGILNPSRLGSGSASTRAFLRGDGVWVLPAYRTATTSTSMVANERTLFVNAGGAVTVTLPSAATMDGSEIIIKVTSGAVTIAAAAGQTVEGSATYAIPAGKSAVTFMSNGAAWYIIGLF